MTNHDLKRTDTQQFQKDNNPYLGSAPMFFLADSAYDLRHGERMEM